MKTNAESIEKYILIRIERQFVVWLGEKADDIKQKANDGI